jgi:ubiquinone biosynthesis protein Coq4
MRDEQEAIAFAVAELRRALLRELRLIRQAKRLACVECGREWDDDAERWRTYLTVDGATALYCPDCSASEFGPGSGGC